MKTEGGFDATLVRDLGEGWKGTAKLWKLSRPLAYGYGEGRATTEYVVTTAVIAMFSGAETYIFPCDESGVVVDWGELGGSYRGGLSHEKAIRGLREDGDD